MSVVVRLAGLILASLIMSAPSIGWAQQPAYQGVPAGFDFPANETALLNLRDTQDVVQMRRHAWSVFAGLTSPTTSGEAVWETWYPVDAAFSADPVVPALTSRHQFQPLRQLAGPQGTGMLSVGSSGLSFVMFNKEAFDRIRSEKLYLKSTLAKLNADFAATTPVEQRQIKPFDRSAVSLKLVWKIVSQSGMTQIQVWDNRPTAQNSAGNPPSSWERVVLVDPSRSVIPLDEAANITWRSRPLKAHVVPVNAFYSFRISQGELASVQREVGNAKVGDYAVLVAMHYTTKEIPDWIWTTLWWHDRPGSGPFAADRPTTVQGPWRNYLMDTTWSMDTPREYDGTPNSAFNPYLEAGFKEGMSSNCMTCHQAAVWPVGPGRAFLPVTRGARAPDDPLFLKTTKLDFLWSIVDRAN